MMEKRHFTNDLLSRLAEIPEVPLPGNQPLRTTYGVWL
jgi:hypothetical protein